MPSILIIQEHMPVFRVGFYEILREKLAAEGVELDLIYASNQRNTFVKGELDWAIQVPIRWWKGKLGWQPVLKHCRKRDLVIVQQETKYLVNPVLQLWSKLGGPKIAYWGHGRNFQTAASGSMEERIKTWLSKRVDWWFAYNELSAREVAKTGFPTNRITRVMNAIDTKGLREIRSHVSEQDLAVLRDQLGISSAQVAVYTGGLYQSKRLAFLLETADRVKQRIPDFHLIVIGAGPDAGVVEEAAKTRPWIHAVGAKSDEEKVPYWMISKLVLIPGLVGLVVVDSFALGVPLVTTDYPYHSPEIDYLENGRNGLLVRCGEDVETYASEVVRLLEDEDTRARLAAEAEADGARYSLEIMAANFAGGVMQCLSHGQGLSMRAPPDWIANGKPLSDIQAYQRPCAASSTSGAPGGSALTCNIEMRILLSCYYFSPYRGGEAAVGWKYASGLASLGHDVTVLYGDLSAEQPMRKDLERYQAEASLPSNLQAVYVEADSLTRIIHDWHAKPGLWFLYYPAYRRWQSLALDKARQLHAEQAFDLAHHLTIIGYREPGLLWRLGIPFFWGPINGAASMPWGFIPSFGLKGRYQHVLRNLLNSLQMRLPGRSRRAAAHACKIWAVTEEDRRMVEDIWGFKAETMIETGATPIAVAQPRSRAMDEPLRLVWCGILEARKSLDLVLRALTGLPAEVEWQLDVIGDGAERPRWEHLANELSLQKRVVWHGRVSHAEAQRLMNEGHVLVHSSLKEGTPHVVLEAMAQAMPVICHDACGMGVAVDDKSGIKVPMINPQTSIQGFRDAILSLIENPERLESLSAGALRRAHELSWENKVRTVADAYLQVLNRKP